MSMVREPHHDKIREPHHDKFESIIKCHPEVVTLRLSKGRRVDIYTKAMVREPHHDK
jgi:hypothetical protein